MSKAEGNLAVKLSANIEIRMHKDMEASAFGKIREYLTAYNEKTLGVTRNAALMAAYIDDEVAGGITFRWYGDSAFLDYVAVGEKWRGQGVGKQLLLAVEAQLQRHGCRQVTVDTEAFQAPDFYRRMGYELVATVPNYICGYDQFVMRKVLSGKEAAG